MTNLPKFLLYAAKAAGAIFITGSIVMLIGTFKKSPVLDSAYRVEIVSKDVWGSARATNESRRHELSYITLHHSGEDFDKDRDTADYLRTLQTWSREERGWMDIPYHFMIDPGGTIYEARDPVFAGDTNTTYDPAGHLLTCVIGNYENAEPSPEQLEALINLMAWQCEEYDIDPSTLKGHRDYAGTACPGENLYAYLENDYLVTEIIKRVGLVERIERK